MGNVYFDVDRCVMCGDIVDEGRQVCVNCEDRVNREHEAFLAEKAAKEAQEQKKRRRFGLFRRR